MVQVGTCNLEQMTEYAGFTLKYSFINLCNSSFHDIGHRQCSSTTVKNLCHRGESNPSAACKTSTLTNFYHCAIGADARTNATCKQFAERWKAENHNSIYISMYLIQELPNLRISCAQFQDQMITHMMNLPCQQQWNFFLSTQLSFEF